VAIVLVSISSCQTGGMSGTGGGLSWKNKLKIADKFYNEGFFYDASHYYEEVLTDQPEKTDVTYKLAESYYYSRDYVKANENYKIVKDQNLQLYPLSQFKYALTLKFNGDYEAAKTEFAKFIKGYRASDAVTYKKIVANEIKGCEYAIKAIEKPLNVLVVHMGREVNAAYTEASPFPVGKDKLIFASLRSDTVISSEDLKAKEGRFKLYQSLKTGNRWSQGELLSETINEPGKDVANGAYSPDGKYFYFTQCESNKVGKLLCDLYRSKVKGEKFGKPEILGENINLPDFTSTHPTLGEYRKGSQILYFVSDMPGGLGGMDIWYSEVTKTGTIKKPRNAGKKINTIGNEITPFYNNVSKILYFSSNGHPSIGGYDVFTTEGRMRKWTRPENAGYPLNSSVDDMYFVADADEEGGYFVSNRIGAIALKI